MLKLPQPRVLIEGTFGLQKSGETHTFHLMDAGRVTITGYWSSSDGVYNYYDGTVLDAGDRDGEREWLKAWVQAGPKPLIRVDHKNRKIGILTYLRQKID